MNQCEVCHKCFSSAWGLMVHYRIHTGERPHKCDICGKAFRQKSHLAKHYVLHGDQGSQSCKNIENCVKEAPGKQVVAIDVKNLHKCEICDDTFTTETKMRNHLRWHKLRKRYKCNICGHCLKHPVAFRKHRQHHVDAQKGCENTLQLCDNDQQPYGDTLQRCDNTLQQCNTASLPCDGMVQFCGDDSQFHGTLLRDGHSEQQPESMAHVKQQHPVNKADEKTVKQQHYCNTCKKKFTCNFSYKRHINEFHMEIKRAKKINSVGEDTSLTQVDKKDACPKSSKSKEFPCLICHKKFASSSSRTVHFQRIHSSKIYKCDVCLRVYGVMRDLRYHYKNAHNLDLPHGCDISGKHFRRRNKLKEHYAVHDTDEQEKLRVEERKQKKLRQPQKCIPPRSSQSLADSSKTVSKKSRECSICGKRFKFPSRLNSHMIIHERQKPTSPNSEFPYQCDICENLYRFPSRLRVHYQNTHKMNVPSPQPYWCKIKAKIHKCNVCSCTFPFEWLLKKHQLTHDDQASPRRHSERPASKNGPYTCDVCRKTFRYPSQLRAHYVRHKKKGQDEISEGADHEATTSIQMEVPRKEPIFQPYSCNFCRQSFSKTSDLKRHCQTQHNTDRLTDSRVHTSTFHAEEDKKRSWCSSGKIALDKTCKSEKSPDKRRRKSSLKGHHVCDICGARFISYGNLTMHLNIHFGRRPYSCRFCPKRFRQAGHLTAHCKNVHGQAFPFRCDLCKMQFKGQVKMRKHKEDVHGVTRAQEEHQEVLENDVSEQRCIDFEQSHYTKVVNSNQTGYACNFCDSAARTFKSLSGLRRHITVVHKASARQLVHEDDHPQDSNVPFDLPRVVTMPRDENPIKITISEEIFRCNVCSVIVHGADALEAHELAHVKAESPHSTSPITSFAQPPAPSIPRKFECKFCGQEFDSTLREAFDKHQLEHEFAAEEPIGTTYMCVECDKEFTMANDLVKHYEETH